MCLAFIGVAATLFLIVALITGMIGAWDSWVAAWTWGLTYGVPAAGVLTFLYAGVRGVLWYVQQWEELEDRRAERTRLDKTVDAENELKYAEAAKHRALAKQMYFSLPVDERGNALFHNPYTNQLTPFLLNYQEHPQLTSMHYSVRQEHQKGQSDQQGLLSTGSTKPSVTEMVKHVERNSFEIPLGASIRNAIGQMVIVNIFDVNIKIIGTSRMGKSCLAAALIDILSQTHDASLVTIALLDLENKTSKLFEGFSHLATLEQGGKKLPLHARDPKTVANYVHLIRGLMDYRYTLPEPVQEVQTHMLVYIEEFLSLKRHKDLTDGMRERLTDDLNELAIRGLKVHIHLMCCAQVDYVDPDLHAFANNFALNMSFSVRPQAAAAAGFLCYGLLRENYMNRVQGQFVVEGIGCTDIVAAPDYDVKALLKQKTGVQGAVSSPETSLNQLPERGHKPDENQSESGQKVVLTAELDGQTWQVEGAEWKIGQILATLDAIQEDQFKAIWNVSPGPGERYKKAKAERTAIYRHIQVNLRKG